MAGTLILTLGGGIACGAVIAGLVFLVAGRTADHLVEITFTTVAASGSFLLAEHLGSSVEVGTMAWANGRVIPRKPLSLEYE